MHSFDFQFQFWLSFLRGLVFCRVRRELRNCTREWGIVPLQTLRSRDGYWKTCNFLRSQTPACSSEPLMSRCLHTLLQ